MISIRLDPSVFLPGGKFEGVPENRAVLLVGDAKWNPFAGRTQPIYDVDSPLYQPTQYVLSVNAFATQLEDTNFEYIMNYQSSYSGMIIEFLSRGLIIVEQNGTPLTVAQVREFAA